MKANTVSGSIFLVTLPLLSQQREEGKEGSVGQSKSVREKERVMRMEKGH